MRWRRFLPALAVLLTTVVSLAGATTLAQASPSAAYSAPKEGAKVTLGQTSIDGPAITGAPGVGTVLAWTGTDPAHHLNLMTSSDGLHYGNKHILPETSLWRPAVTFIESMRGGPYGTIVLAWTGTDPAHTLNLEFISTPTFTVKEKITYWGETSFTAPSVTTINWDVNSDIYLAWSGNDRAHSLNVIHHTTNPEKNEKGTMWGWTSISRPDISHDMSGASSYLILAWTKGDNHLGCATSPNGQNWNPVPSLSQKSAWAPSMIGFYQTTVTMPNHWLAWTGTGTSSTYSITVTYTQHFPSWNDAGATTTLHEAAISSPALAYNGYSAATSQVLLAWTGIDPAHHLNVAVVYVTAS